MSLVDPSRQHCPARLHYDDASRERRRPLVAGLHIRRDSGAAPLTATEAEPNIILSGHSISATPDAWPTTDASPITGVKKMEWRFDV